MVLVVMLGVLLYTSAAHIKGVLQIPGLWLLQMINNLFLCRAVCTRHV